MIDFASILASVERSTREPDAQPWRKATASISARMDASKRPAVAPVAAREAYAFQALQEPTPEPARPDLAALRQAIAAASGNPVRLRALRRLAARHLHPDRGGDGAQLAECNALIDAALKTARKRT